MTRAPITQFAALPHEELVRILRAGDVGSVRSTGDSWRQITRSLTERADEVQRELVLFSPQWRGGAADQYKIMMAEFVEGVDTASELLASVRDLVYSTADALKRAQDEMPAAVPVPALSSVATMLSTGPSSAATAVWDGLAPDQQLAVAEELRQVQATTQAAGAAHARAVAIMNELAVHYLDVEDSVPALPVAAEAPAVPADSAAANTVATALSSTGSPLTGTLAADPTADAGTITGLAGQTGQPGPTLFRDMFAAGTLAASAAVLGRFRLGTGWLDKRRKAKAAATPSGSLSDAGGGASTGGGPGAGGGAGGAPLPQVGGTGGGVASGGGAASGGGVIGASAVDPPKANPVLAGGAATPLGAASAGLVAPSVGGGVSTPAATGGGMGMMPPMMPPGGGGEGAGMGRRIPPWLVETEPVFGESVPVTPSVIGAEGEDAKLRPRPFA
ncbi:MAG: WXG100 family type VII secretion target [Phycicoccus sp.]